MATPKTNLKDYNVLVFVPVMQGAIPTALFKWALRHRTHVVSGSQNPTHNGVWPGVASISGFRQTVGALGEANIVFPSVSIQVARGPGDDGLSDEAVARIRSLDFLVGFRVELFLVSSEDTIPSASNRFHVGVIERGDVEIGSDYVRISCRDRMEGEDRTIPRTRFPESGLVEERQFGQPIPSLFGAWNRESSDYWVSATCVDTVCYSDTRCLKAKLCRPGENGIASFGLKAKWLDSDGRFKRDETGYREQNITVLDAAEGRFELAGTDFNTMERRWEEGDRIFVLRPQGEKDASGNLITSPSEVIRHLLTDARVGMGLSQLTLDDESFSAVGEVMNYYGYQCRGLIDEETTVLNAVSEICFEFGLRLVVRDGLYALVYLGWGHGDSEPERVISPGQILDWREWNDRQGVGSEGLALKFRRRPEDGAFTRTAFFTSGESRDVGFSTIESHWIYDDETAELRASNWSLMFGGVIRTLRMTMDFEGLDVRLGEFVSVVWPEGDGIFQVSDINFTFDPPIRLELELQTMTRPSQAGVWAADQGGAVPDSLGGGTAPEGWDDADSAQKESLSFWGEDDGHNPDGTPGKVWGR